MPSLLILGAPISATASPADIRDTDSRQGYRIGAGEGLMLHKRHSVSSERS
jgi:hypothetical protein